MKTSLLALSAVALVLSLSLRADESVDDAMVARFKIEAFQHSTAMETLAELTDVYGARLRGSPSYAAAADWAKARLNCGAVISTLKRFSAQPFLGQRELLAERVVDARLLEGVAGQHREVCRGHLAASVVPRTLANAVARVDRAGIPPVVARRLLDFG